jgi:hypothetical protein
MSLAIGDLTISIQGIDCRSLLSQWQWLLQESYDIALVTCIGDVLLKSAKGSFYWLDVGAGDLEKIANSESELKVKMTVPEDAERWFMALTVYDLIDEQGPLEYGECFGYKVAPVLGGSYDRCNFERISLHHHLSSLGQIHKRVQDYPNNTPISNLIRD